MRPAPTTAPGHPGGGQPLPHRNGTEPRPFADAPLVRA